MGNRYDIHILDEWLNSQLVKAGQEYPDLYKGLANQVYVNTPLAKIGQSELAKIGSGDYGSTMYAGAIRNEAARNLQNLKYSFGPAAATAGMSGKNADNIYTRLLAKRAGEVQDRAADQLEQGLPNYVSSAGNWAEAENRGLAQKGNFYNAAENSLMDTLRMRQSNTTFTQRKTLWDKVKTGLQIGGGIALGALTGGWTGALSGGLSALGGGGAQPNGTVPRNIPSTAVSGRQPFQSYASYDSIDKGGNRGDVALPISLGKLPSNLPSVYQGSSYETAAPAAVWQPKKVSGGGY